MIFLLTFHFLPRFASYSKHWALVSSHDLRRTLKMHTNWTGQGKGYDATYHFTSLRDLFPESGLGKDS